MNETAEQATDKAEPRRIPLGRRSKAKAAETKFLVVGDGTKVPVLDVAAFNSFVG